MFTVLARVPLALLLLAILATPAFARVTLPPGYRFPTDGDVSGDWREHRKTNPHPFHVRGDFDHNGSMDDAWVLLRRGGRGWAVYAFLAVKNGTGASHKIMADDSSAATSIFIDLVSEPGVWKTACGKGYRECAEGEPESVTLHGGELTVTHFESSDFVVVWRAKAKTFQCIQLSD